jgi:excisionase family DNA binding protein
VRIVSQQHTDAADATVAAGLRKALYRIPEAMELLSLSRTVIYEQIRAGRLRTVAEGRARRIPATAIAEYVALLERESSTGRAA